MLDLNCFHIHITGIVQGVGFRPFVYNLAKKNHLYGMVKNTSAGVDIEIEGMDEDLDAFISELKTNFPPLARIVDIKVSDGALSGYRDFVILQSEEIQSAFQAISADVAICPDCLNELFKPQDHRFRYPFINCTNCGPRFTIIKDIPYDRPKTSMSIFPMCSHCETEYHNPGNRRFHAQPIACKNCGPTIWLERSERERDPLTASPILKYKNGGGVVGETPGVVDGEAALQKTRSFLAEGNIVAIKGLGGFHLCCNALDPQAVTTLRERKLRIEKPFAVMMPDIETIERYCTLTKSELELLKSAAHPIVLLQKKADSKIPVELAPGQSTIGVMLPYTPLHAVLLEKEAGFPEVLVMTSGNSSDEPICTSNDDARARLDSIADYFLMHDRDIHIRTDDSVARIFNESIYPIRRSRGYSPLPIMLPWSSPSILACGGELKNTFCLTKDNYAFVSHHIGDLENYETLNSYEQGIAHFENLFRVTPDLIACDLHPNYLSTRYANERAVQNGVECLGIQHHHAHIASLMVEKGINENRQVIGVAFDGTGFGDDGAIWGGEFLVTDYLGYQRVAHLEYFPLAGGDASIRRPYRTALSLLYSHNIDWESSLACINNLRPEESKILSSQLEKKINSPLTSSVGRLFDAIAALTNVRQIVNYEAQAAIEFEARIDPTEEGLYEFDFEEGVIKTKIVVEAILRDINAGISIGRISGKFHNGLAKLVLRVCSSIKLERGIIEVALSGGVWQNMSLLKKTVLLLENSGFRVYTHQVVPTNDGGLSLGQAAIATFRSK